MLSLYYKLGLLTASQIRDGRGVVVEPVMDLLSSHMTFLACETGPAIAFSWAWMFLCEKAFVPLPAVVSRKTEDRPSLVEDTPLLPSTLTREWPVDSVPCPHLLSAWKVAMKT